MDLPNITVPVWNETSSAEDRQDRSYSYNRVKILISHRFHMTYHLLCRWQTELEFFLYQFCKTVAPELINDCHWSCPEAAELTRLSEKVTEFFCFHHKTIFKDCGISEQERESFCSELQEIRQIRHFAVHRVEVNAATINKYAKCALNVLGIVKRLGGQDFGKDYGEAVCPVPFPSHYNNRSHRHELQLDRFVNSFWETEGHLISQMSSHIPPSQHEEYHIDHNLNEELKKAHLQRMIKEQTSAATRRSENIAKMTEDFERAKARKLLHQEQDFQNRKLAAIAREKGLNISREEAEGARLREAKRAEHSQKQQDDAQLKKVERAEHSQKQQEHAQLKKVERAELSEAKRAEHSQKQRDDAQLKKAKRAEHSQKQQDKAQPKKAKRAEHSQKQQDKAQPKKTKGAEYSQKQQDKAQPKKTKGAEYSQKQDGAAQPKKTKGAEHSKKQQDKAQPKKTKGAEYSQKQDGAAQPKKTKGAEHSKKQHGAAQLKKVERTDCT
jgi:hypothetical protein